MPTMERWHCLMTEAERENSADMHLLDWRPYVKDSGDPYLSLRRTEQNPTDKALTLSEWNGMKIWQIATIPPSLGETREPKKWAYTQSGVNYLTDRTEREADRSRTPARDDRNRGGKGKGSGRKGKKPVKVTGAPEGEEVERVGRKYFPGPATLPEAWREKEPEELVMSGPIDANPGRATMAFKLCLMHRYAQPECLKIRLGIPSYGIPQMLTSGRYAIKQEMTKETLSNIRHCHLAEILDVGCVHLHGLVNSCHVVGATPGSIGDAPTQLRVGEHVPHISMLLTHLTK